MTTPADDGIAQAPRDAGLDPAAPPALLWVSACLLGRPVRYDGRDKYTPALLQRLAPWCRFNGGCPEVAAGLGTPRPPIALYLDAGAVHLRDCRDPQRELTEAVAGQALRVPAVHGALLKARSPSCGVGSAALHGAEGSAALTDGAFAAALRRQQPDLPMVDEPRLAEPDALQAFVVAVWRYRAQQSERKTQS